MAERFSNVETEGERVDEIVATDGYRLAYRTWDSPSPRATLILLSGIMSHSAWFRSIAEPLRHRGLRVVAPDRRGSGLNRVERGNAASPEALVDDVLAFVERERGQTPLFLAGWCWGAIPAICAALRLGSALDGLVLAAPGVFPSELVKRRMAEELERHPDLDLDDASLANPVTEDLFTDGPGRDFILKDELRLRRITPRFTKIGAKLGAIAAMRLQRLEQPVLLLLASRDDTVDDARTREAFGRLGDERITIATLEARHGLPFDAPDAMVEHVTGWIEQTLAEGSRGR